MLWDAEMSERQDRLRDAARTLRKELGLNQPDFSRRIGRGLNSVVRYEQTGPTAEALVPYGVVALQAGLDNLAKIFREALFEEVGPELESLVCWKAGSSGSGGVQVPPGMRQLVEAFIAFMNAKDVTPVQELARSSLKEMLSNDYSRRKGKKTAG